MGGKPDKLMRNALILALHREAMDAEGKPTKKLNLVAEALVQNAIDGDVPAIKEICDRVDGRSESTSHIHLTRDVRDLCTADILAALASLGTVSEEAGSSESNSVH